MEQLKGNRLEEYINAVSEMVKYKILGIIVFPYAINTEFLIINFMYMQHIKILMEYDKSPYKRYNNSLQ